MEVGKAYLLTKLPLKVQEIEIKFHFLTKCNFETLKSRDSKY